MHIPVTIEEELSELPDIYYVLAWTSNRRYWPITGACWIAGNRILLPE